ncbi:hypothetical protein KY320_00745, partial [Candidatus Woesearchaeota archaeon]|nr:hypothetical protein [Candidatus Woesearchaeota archaeon]
MSEQNIEMIYALPNEGVQQYRDVTAIEGNPDMGKLIVVPADENRPKLFSLAANDLDIAIGLRDDLKELQQSSLDPKFSVSRDLAKRFNTLYCGFNTPGHLDAVYSILTKAVDVCREKKAAGLGFFSGDQFDYQALSEEGTLVSFGDYMIFGSTLLEGARDPIWKAELIQRGEALFGSRAACFVNPPALNAAIETIDGYELITHRDKTVEFPYKLHKSAAGHHRLVHAMKDDGTGKMVVPHQVDFVPITVGQMKAELSLTMDEVANYSF